MDLGYRRYLPLFVFLFVFPVYAGVIEVTPVQLYVSVGQPIGILRVANKGSESSLLQLSLVDWQHSGGKDIYRRSSDILMTPPLFRLPVHKTQVIRFALRHPIYNALQKTYRVHIREVNQRRKRKLGQELYFLMDVSLPLFVQPEHLLERFVWSIQDVDPGHVKLRLYNDGNVTLFVSQWQLLGHHNQKKQATFTYILPRQSHSWVETVDSHTLFTDIEANINGQNRKSTLHKV